MNDIIFRVLGYIVITYVFVQFVIIYLTSGLLYGESKHKLRRIRAHEMFKHMYAETNEKFGISDIDKAIEELLPELKKPFTYIWFSKYFKIKSLINTLYAMRLNYTELVRWYDEEIK